MNAGEIRKLPKSNSPMWTEQWAYQGTAKNPYIISSKRKPGDGEKSGWDYVWACSCADWTKHMPRVDCKHIIGVKIKENILIDNAPGKASLDPGMQKEFEKFLALKQGNVVQLGSLNSLKEKGRKFRI